MDKAVSGLRSDAIGIRNGGMDVHSRFQMLEAFYTAPEAADLFATTRPVMDEADVFATKLETVADALDAYSLEARPLAERLEQLKADAFAFVDSVEGDDDWTEDEEKVHRNDRLIDDVTATKLAFEEAERRAGSKIAALVGGPQFVADDGDPFIRGRLSDGLYPKTVPYGYELDVLKGAKELPWGTADEQTYEAWSLDWFGHGAKSFFWDGIYKDGIEVGLDGLWTLVGGHGSDAMGGAWSGLKDVVTGVGLYTMTPYDAFMDWAIGPDKESADEIRAKKAAKEFGKAVVAWDQWQENPTRAAGTTFFNVLTLGAGPLSTLSKTSEAGGVAKGAGVAAKVGEFIDPLTLGLKATGKAVGTLPRLSDLTSRITTGAGAAADAQRVHSVIELSDGSKVVIENGEFVAYDRRGNLVADAPRQERSAAAEPMTEQTSAREREFAGAGGRSQLPQASMHASSGSRSAAEHTGSSVREHTSGTSSPTHHDASGSGSESGLGHGPPSGAGRPDSPHEANGGTGNGGARELTIAERKRIQDEHVWKANNDPAWLEEHYDILGRRKSASAIVDGVELPVLSKDANNKWISKYDVPNGPSEVKSGRTPLLPDSVDSTHRPALDKAAADRRASVDLTNAEREYGESHSAAAKKALDDAQQTYHQQLGDVPNNSKISERLGEKAAELHVVPHEFPNAEWVELPKTPNGANMFDQLYKLGDDGYLIVEAKAPSGDLDWRRGVGPAQGMMVKQGTKEYVQTIIAEMQSRATRSPEDGRIAMKLMKAMSARKLQYVLVKAKDHTGSSYAGAVLEHFKIY
nr:hypothetical protein [Streptomyces sp. HUCO-GS316]